LTQKETCCHDLEISLEFCVLCPCKCSMRSLSASSSLLSLFKENWDQLNLKASLDLGCVITLGYKV
jgi:hypothetical protein